MTRALRKLSAVLSAVMLMGLSASAKPLDEETIVTLLGAGFSDTDIAGKIREEGYFGSEDAETLKMLREAGAGMDLILAVEDGHSKASGLRNLARIEASQLGITDQEKIDQFVRDYVEQNIGRALSKQAAEQDSGLESLARIEAANLGITEPEKLEQFVRDYLDQNTVSDKFSPQAEPDFYAENPDTPRVQIVKREGKYGLKFKGKVVVETEWDYYDSKFNPDGSGTFTFSRWSKEGLRILDDFIADKNDVHTTIGNMEAANLGITDEKERRAFLREYIMNRQPANKIKWFEKSFTYEMPASDDPLALIAYERGSGLKRRDGSIFIPGNAEFEDIPFDMFFYLPAESVGASGNDAAVTPTPLSDRELKELTGIYYINFLRTLGNMNTLSKSKLYDPRKSGFLAAMGDDPKKRMDLIDDDALQSLFGPKTQAFFKKWAQEERDTRFLFIVLVEQLDRTWRAELRAEVQESPAE